jgi:hypothetical protein
MPYQCQTNQPGTSLTILLDFVMRHRIASLAQDTKQRSLADLGWKTGDV